MLLARGVHQGEFIRGFVADEAGEGIAAFRRHRHALVAVENLFGRIKHRLDKDRAVVFRRDPGQVRTDLSPLADLENLETLDLSDNPISDVSALLGLDHLEHLDLSGTQVSNLAPLSRLIERGLVVSLP